MTGWEGWEFDYGQKTIEFVVGKDNLVTYDDIYLNVGYQGAEENPIIAYLKDGTQNDQVLVRDDDGNPLFFKLSPYYAVPSLKGGYGQNPLYVSFPGFDLASATGARYGVYGTDGEPYQAAAL